MLRQLRRHRAFAGTLIAVLAIGVAVTTAMFSIVYGVLLRALPYPDAGRLVTLTSTDPRIPQGRTVAGAADYYDWRARQQVFENMAMVRPVTPFNLTGAGEPERLAGARVTASLCDTLGVTPILGRCFTEAEEREPARASSVVILSHAVWQRRFGGDPAVVGRTIQLNGRGHEVVGVMGPAFQFPSREIQAWGVLYIPPSELTLRRDYSYLTVARLKPGVSLGAAAAHMAAVAAALAREHPSTNRDDTVSVAPMHAVMTATVRRPLLVLLGAVGLLFAITVFSIVNLVLVQLAARAPELALRATLGASRPRLAAQLVGELVPLALTGALAGLAGAWLLLRSIVATLPATLPRVEEIALHVPVALFGIALTATAMGIPALVAMWNARTSLQRGPASWVRLRDWLVTAQVAATVTLLVASALFATSLARLRAVDPGLDATRVLTLQLAVDRARHGGDEGVAAYLGQVADAVRALPGVEAVGLINRLPLGGQVQAGDIRVEGQDAAIATSWRSIDAGYTTALRVPLVAGRGFDARDSAQAPPVGLVDERLASMLGGPRAMLGKRFRIDVTASDISWVEVVGVVGHVRDEGLEREGRPLVYWPLAQRTQDRMAMVVKTAGDPNGMTAAVREAIRDVDPGQPLYDVRSMTQVVERSLIGQRINMLLVGSFAGLALLLASIGLYSVTSNLAARRSREFGIRLALGASPGDLLLMTLGQGLARAACGLAVGLLLSAALTRWLGSVLHGVSALDTLTYVSVSTLLLLIVLAASYPPARRASKTDALTSIRCE